MESLVNFHSPPSNPELHSRTASQRSAEVIGDKFQNNNTKKNGCIQLDRSNPSFWMPGDEKLIREEN